MDSKEVSVLLKKLSCYFPNQIEFPTGNDTEDEVMIRIWLEQLKPFPAKEVWEATKMVIYSQPNYAPNPIKIVKQIYDFHSDEPSADVAWKKVQRHLKWGDKNLSGVDKEKEALSDTVKEALKRIGGKGAIKASDPGDPRYMAEFKKTYNRLLEEQKQEQVKENLTLKKLEQRQIEGDLG